MRIFGEEYELNARVQTINALSAHADRGALMAWVDAIRPRVKKAFAVHGDEPQVTAMGGLLRTHGVGDVAVPAPGERFTI